MQKAQVGVTSLVQLVEETKGSRLRGGDDIAITENINDVVAAAIQNYGHRIGKFRQDAS